MRIERHFLLAVIAATAAVSGSAILTPHATSAWAKRQPQFRISQACGATPPCRASSRRRTARAR
jgi:hypothetical protein